MKAEHEGVEPCKILKIEVVLPFPAYFHVAFCFLGFCLLSINGLGFSQPLLSNMSVTRFTHTSVRFQFVPPFINPTASQVASSSEPAEPSWTLSPLSSPPTSPPTRQRIFFSFDSVVQSLSGLPIHNMMNTCSEGNLCWRTHLQHANNYVLSSTFLCVLRTWLLSFCCRYEFIYYFNQVHTLSS